LQTETEPRHPQIDQVQTESPESHPDQPEGQTNTETSLADENSGVTNTEKRLSKPAKPKKETEAEPKLFVRGVDRETKSAIGKAAKKLGKTQGEFFNQEVRELCNGILSKKAEPPASPADVQGMVAAQIATAQPAMIDEIVERLAERLKVAPPEKKGFFARLFS
jgi:hypothetical protein